MIKWLKSIQYVIFLVVLLFTQTGNVTAQQPPALPGDANGDGLINQLDYQQVISNFGQQGGLSDLNLDNVVNIFDLNLVITNYGNQSGSQPNASPSIGPNPHSSPPITPPPTPTAPPTTPPPPPSTPPPPPTTPPPPPPPQSGLWISPQELSSLPMGNDPAWLNMKVKADTQIINPDVDKRDLKNVDVLAKALTYARDNSLTCGNYNGKNCRQQVRQALEEIIGTESSSGDNLAVLRNMGTYVISADLIDLKNYGDGFDTTFRIWIQSMLTKQIGASGGCSTITNCHMVRPNNFGAHAAASRIAIALYLNDWIELNNAVAVFNGWLGNRSSYTGFNYSDPYVWHPVLDANGDPVNPVGINPVGSTVQGHNASGILPDDQRRQSDHGCPDFSWPPCKENYVWEALQGAVVAAELLHRAGYDVYNWQDQALLRAVTWLHDPDGSLPQIPYNWYPAEGDDRWLPWIVNKRYGTSFQATVNTTPGKNMGWTDWTHAN